VANLESEVQSRLVLADRARRAGQLDEARHAVGAALELAPAHPVALNLAGLIALDQQAHDAAADFFARAAAADPKEPLLRLNLANAHRHAGRIDDARQALHDALALNQHHFPSLLRRAELEEAHGKPSAAVLAWDAVIRIGQQIPQPGEGVLAAIDHGRAFLAQHAADLAVKYDALFGAVRQSDPDMRRFNRCLELVLGKSRVFRNECHGLYYPFLPADEYFDRRHFPWFAAIEAATDAIRAEAVQLFAKGNEALRPYVRLESGAPPSKWTPLDGSLDWTACFLWEYGAPNQPVLDACPATAAALAATPLAPIPGKAPSAFFSLLKAGAHIPPHTGVTNSRAIIHLPLVVPPGCTFRVGGETRPWVEGEAFAFDDTIEHEAMNPSDQDRIVLIFDVWNPHLSPREQELIGTFFANQD
jgi:aspartate beta-hydroxylase